MKIDRRIVSVLSVGLFIIFFSVLLMGCGRPVQMCAVEEVEINRDSKGKIVSYELDYMDGREVKISAIQYNLYRGKTQAPCRL